MHEIEKLAAAALTDFKKIVESNEIASESWPKPHTPLKLPQGKMAVYAFFLNGKALKIGHAGASSNARYQSHHYNPNSSRSNLARSILNDPARVGATGVNEFTIGNWIRQNTDRVNFLIPISATNHTRTLLETFLHHRWQPMFEGHGS
jgi:hypothetical protein